MKRPNLPEDKLVFLDIDGVLNSDLWYCELYRRREETRKWSFGKYHMDPHAVKLLNELSPAKIVISSSWGYDATTVQSLLQAGLQLEIIGGTSINPEHEIGGCRGNSIAVWFYEHYKHVPRDENFKSFGWLTGVTYSMHKGITSIEFSEESRIVNYVIFDDWDDMLLQQKDHFIHVNKVYGLTEEDIEKAKTILKL